MLKEDTSSWRKNWTLPVALAFLTAVAVAMVTAVVINISFLKVRVQAQNRFDTETEFHTNYLNDVISTSYNAALWTINSYLSSRVTLQYDSDGEQVSRYIMSDETRRTLSVDGIYDSIISFINYNNIYHSVVFVFEPGVVRDAPSRGIAAKAMPDDTVRYDLLESDSHLLDGNFYRTVAESNGIYYHPGHILDDGSSVLTYAVPVHGEDGKLLGELWVDIVSDYASELLAEYASEQDAEAMILDENMLIVASGRNDMVGRRLIQVMPSAPLIKDIPSPQTWYRRISSSVNSGRKLIYRSDEDGEHFCTYIYPLQFSTHHLLVVQSESGIYDSLNRFKGWFLLVFGSGQVAMLACISFIVLAFRRKNASNRRMESELETASRIQQGILPGNPGRSELPAGLNLYGYQHPAKQVGGDFYDYSVIGSRLYFCIGDVSGKGVPAALVMSQLCSLFRYVIRTETRPCDIVTSINKAVMEHSDDSMMCTFFVGVLDLVSGRMDFCNAGHTPPILIRNAGAECSYMKIRPNMPLYAFENWNYVQEAVSLESGDRLFLYTDGVIEAKNKKHGFFGEDAALNAVRNVSDRPFRELVDGVLRSVEEFVCGGVQHDDITIFCVEYQGRHSSTLHYEHLPKDVTGVVSDILAACDRTDDMRLRLALEETVQNIADYAYVDRQDDMLDVIINPANEAGELIFTLIDSGVPFNPLEGTVPDLSLPLEQRDVGGLGIHFARRIMKRMSYSYKHKQNNLKLTYQIP